MRTVAFCLAATLTILLAGCGGSSANSGPADAVTQWKNAVADGKPEVLWQSLPAGYQKDIKDLLAKFADKMDAEIWNTSFDVLKSAASLGKDKKEIIAELAEGQIDDPEEGIEAVADLLNVIARSDLGDLGELAKLDVEKFLATDGAEVFKKIDVLMKISPQADQYTDDLKKLTELKESKVATASVEENTATVLLQVGDQNPKLLTLVKVEDKWLPKDLVDGWEEFVQQANETMDEMEDNISDEQKQTAIDVLRSVENLLDEMSDADSKEAMIGIATKGAVEVMGAMGGGEEDGGGIEGL